MRFFLLCFISLFSFNVIAQSDCESAIFLRKNEVEVKQSTEELWYKFRAKGNLLNFVGELSNSDSLFEYEIYPFETCFRIQSGVVTPLRSVKKNGGGMTEEIWQKFIEDGICICGTCLSKIEADKKKALKVNQGEFYLLRVISNNQPFKFQLSFDEIDSINPIQFSIDSIPPEEIEVGMVYQLKEIFFIPATPQYLPKSLPELQKLQKFLLEHKVLKVQVRGHVNGPAQTKPDFYQTLSDQRARAIQQFLVENGVEIERVDAKGMSNFQMRYPSPKTAYEAGENRRVEIVITAVE